MSKTFRRIPEKFEVFKYTTGGKIPAWFKLPKKKKTEAEDLPEGKWIAKGNYGTELILTDREYRDQFVPSGQKK